MKVFVAGATGETGRRVVAQLVEQEIPVKALVRDRNKAQDFLPAQVELVEGGLSHVAELAEAMEGCTVMVSATGARPSLNPTGPYSVDFIGTKNLVDAAKKAKLKQFVMVSSLCVSKLTHPLNLFWLVLFWKQKAEHYLQKSGLAFTIVRPGGLKSEDQTIPIVMTGADQLFEGSIPRSQVAAVCIESLKTPDAKDKILEIVCSPESPSQPISELIAQIAPA